MADLSPAAANIVADYQAKIKTGVAAEAISAGEALYIDSTDDDELALAKHDGTEAEAQAVGIAIADAANGATVTYITEGELALGSILTAGVVYGLSATYGAVAPITDTGSSDYVTVLGVAKSAGTLEVKIIISGATLA